MRRGSSRIGKAEPFALFMVTMGALFLLGGCGSGGTDSGGLVTSMGQYASLQVSLTTQSVNRLGDTVPITFSIKNIGDRSVFVGYECPYADVRVSQGDTIIWQWSFGQVFACSELGSLLAPGDSLTYSRDWNQKDNEGNQVPGGSYVITSWFDAAGVDGVKVTPQTDLATQPLTIVLQ